MAASISPLKFFIRHLKKNVLPLSGTNFGFGQLDAFLFIFFLKHPKVPNLDAFTKFFLIKGEKSPNLTKFWCIPDPNLFHLIFCDGSIIGGNTPFFALYHHSDINYFLLSPSTFDTTLGVHHLIFRRGIKVGVP